MVESELNVIQFFYGTHKALSWAEIRAKKFYKGLQNKSLYFNGEVFNFLDNNYFDFADEHSVIVGSIFKISKILNAYKTMGGSYKIAKVLKVHSFKQQELDDGLVLNLIYNEINRLLDLHKIDISMLKHLSLNFYSNKQFNINFGQIKLLVKKWIKTNYNINPKVHGRKFDLMNNSAVTNTVLKKQGLELNISVSLIINKIIISKTIDVHNYKLFEILEYDKPERDMQTGMMPIKLAFIMLNLANLRDKQGFWDPMCGTGTLVMAGQFLNLYSYGSDIDKFVLKKAEENIAWLYKTGFVKKLAYKCFKFDVTKPMRGNKILRDIIRFGRFNAVVTEGYLGPARKKPFTSKKQINMLKSKLDVLYKKFLRNVSSAIVPGQKIVFCQPRFKYWDKATKSYKWYQYMVPINKHRYRVVNFETGDLVWEHKKSNVARRVVVLEKIK